MTFTWIFQNLRCECCYDHLSLGLYKFLRMILFRMFVCIYVDNMREKLKVSTVSFLSQVQSDHFEEFFAPELDKHGYQALYKRKTAEVSQNIDLF